MFRDLMYFKEKQINKTGYRLFSISLSLSSFHKEAKKKRPGQEKINESKKKLIMLNKIKSLSSILGMDVYNSMLSLSSIFKENIYNEKKI
jgi:hypothetical protein